MIPIVSVELDSSLRKLQEKWISAERERKEQERIYAREFGPAFAPLFAGLPLHGAPEGMARPKALVSVLGLSWQPIALMAAWVKPERMLVIGTKESFEARYDGDSALALICQVTGLPSHRIEHRQVPNAGEVEIYQEVRDFLSRHGLTPKEVALDPTGGKKAMSVSAGLAAFIEGMWLVYVDYAEYPQQFRSPVPGTEYPRLLTNPLQVLGDLEVDRIRAAFNRGDFAEAEHRAGDLADRLYEPRPAEALALLARGYGAWNNFDFNAGAAALDQASKMFVRHDPAGKWSWAVGLPERVRPHVNLLRTLAHVPEKPESVDAGMPIPLCTLAAAIRQIRRQRYGPAILLLYAAVERFLDLCLRVEFGLDDEEPNFDSIEGRVDQARFDEAGKCFFGKKYRPEKLAGPIMFGNGVQLLAALSSDRIHFDELGKLKGLSSHRNSCEFEHAFQPRPIKVENVETHRELVKKILARACGGMENLDRELDGFQFPEL